MMAVGGRRRALEPAGQRNVVDVRRTGHRRVVGIVRDDELKEARETFEVLVEDRTAPTFTDVPADRQLEATSPAGAVATYTKPTATDRVDGHVEVTCAPASGSDFALGSTTVACAGEDSRGNDARATFTVTVVDTTAPDLTVPDNKTVEATGPAGAAVSFAASAVDVVGPVQSVRCTPESGTTFALGTTTVDCTATDSHANSAHDSFKITVRDTTGPAIDGVPANPTIEATGPTGATFTWASPSATDLVDGVRPVSCYRPRDRSSRWARRP